MSALEELQDTVDALRQERYPEISAELVGRILELEDRYVEDRGPAPRLVERAIDEWLEAAG